MSGTTVGLILVMSLIQLTDTISKKNPNCPINLNPNYPITLNQNVIRAYSKGLGIWGICSGV